MTIDDLALTIESASPEDASRKLAGLLRQWKTDDTTIGRLADLVERYIGNAWFEKDEVHALIYSAWSSFRNDEIRMVAGMSMNERLFVFGLTERFDRAGVDERRSIYEKLEAAA